MFLLTRDKKEIDAQSTSIKIEFRYAANEK
jgi:hypothetical protein